MTELPEPTSRDARVDRLIEIAQHEAAQTPQPSDSPDSGAFPRLAALLAAAAAPDSGPQPGERAALEAFAELVAGTPSLAARRRRRQLAVVGLATTVVVLGGGVAAAASGSLPGAAQSTAKSVLNVVGVHVPGPNSHAGSHPDQRGDADEPGDNDPTPPAVHPTQPTHATTPVGTPPTPGNSGSSRHHGNPTPKATGHPAPQHGKPTAPPVVAHPHGVPTHPVNPGVTHANPRAITH